MRSDRRIDRPLLSERPLLRPLAGRLVSGTPGQAGVEGHAGVHDDLTPRTVSGRLPHAGPPVCTLRGSAAAPATWQRVRRPTESGSGTSATAGHGRLT